MHLPRHIPFTVVQNELLKERDISLTIARLDQLHPHVSGNKLFKLCYFAEACLQTSHKTLLTFGGAYSNHLVATAFFCRQSGIRSIGIVRGERPAILSHTLEQCISFGMELHFISREMYRNIDGNITGLKTQFGEFTLVPEGGYDAAGAEGASLICQLLDDEKATHICTAAGTATTVAGLMKGTKNAAVIAIPAIKNMTDIPERIKFLTDSNTALPVVFGEYHFGGYAKYDQALIRFMNDFYSRYNVPLDFVYTAKMMYAVTDKIKKGYFGNGSRIVCLHTGGLQGNASLPEGSLIF